MGHIQLPRQARGGWGGRWGGLCWSQLLPPIRVSRGLAVEQVPCAHARWMAVSRYSSITRGEPGKCETPRDVGAGMLAVQDGPRSQLIPLCPGPVAPFATQVHWAIALVSVPCSGGSAQDWSQLG